MDALPDAVAENVQHLVAELMTGHLLPGKAVWLACDLLTAGVEIPAAVELAGESPPG